MDKMTWMGFGAGLVFVALLGGMYNAYLNLPPAKPTEEEIRQLLESKETKPAPVPAKPPMASKPVPLERLEGPPRPQSTAQPVPPPTPAIPNAPVQPAAAATSPEAPVMRRSVSPPLYAPGEEMEVAIEIAAPQVQQAELVTIEETLPPGFVYQGLETELPPDKAPETGATGTLLFLWNQPSPMPTSLRYKVSTPTNTSVNGLLRGHVSYVSGGKTVHSRPVVFPLRHQP